MRRILLTSVTATLLLILASLAKIGGCKAGGTCNLNFNEVFGNGSSSET